MSHYKLQFFQQLLFWIDVDKMDAMWYKKHMKYYKELLVYIFLFCISIYSSNLFAKVYKEVNIIGGYSKNDHLKNSIGFEYYEKFSDKYGDYLTMAFSY